MTFSWENIKQNVKDNSPHSETVGKVLGTAVVGYAGILGWHHRESIKTWLSDTWSKWTTPKKKSESGNKVENKDETGNSSAEETL
jgi:hypothetical protein